MQERLQYSIAHPAFQACPKEENDVTQKEQTLLDALETQAARMENIRAMLEILVDWDVYADETLPPEARRRRRRLALSMMESMAHLAQLYHDEAMRLVTDSMGR